MSLVHCSQGQWLSSNLKLMFKSNIFSELRNNGIKKKKTKQNKTPKYAYSCVISNQTSETGMRFGWNRTENRGPDMSLWWGQPASLRWSWNNALCCKAGPNLPAPWGLSVVPRLGVWIMHQFWGLCCTGACPRVHAGPFCGIFSPATASCGSGI